GPYPGLFTESGTVKLLTPTTFKFDATFTITSGTTTVTGTKTATLLGICAPTNFGSQQISGQGDGTYTATITNPPLGTSLTDNGNQHASVHLLAPRAGVRGTALAQNFTSALTVVTLD